MMIKNIAIASVAAAVLLMTGCSTKEPAIDATAGANNGTMNGANSGSNANTSGDAGAVIAPITDAGNNASAVGGNGSNSGVNESDSGFASIFFDFDKYNIREDMKAPMSQNSVNAKGKTIKLEGNCDEFGSDEYNYALGLKRTNAVKTELVNAGVNADSITMISLGEGNPVCQEKTEECWAKNRRVDFKLP